MKIELDGGGKEANFHPRHSAHSDHLSSKEFEQRALIITKYGKQNVSHGPGGPGHQVCDLTTHKIKLDVHPKIEGPEADYNCGLDCVVLEDFKNALKYFKKAADAGYIPAKKKLANVYENGLLGEETLIYRALSLYREIGDTESKYKIANIYAEGTKIEREIALARIYYAEAANAGYSNAMHRVAVLYEEEKRYGEAAKWYEKSINAGCEATPLSQANLGCLYMRGLGVKKDYSKALLYLTDSAKRGCPVGDYYLGILNKNGWGTPQNYQLAMKFFEKAVKGGIKNAVVEIAILDYCGHGVQSNEKVASENVALAFEIIAKEAELGNHAAMLFLGNIYEQGLGIKMDYKQALKWYEKAATGSNEARERLGHFYEFGKGVDLDLDKAFEWYKKCENTINLNNFGLRLIENNNVKKAVVCFETAEEKGCDTALFNLGNLYSTNKYGLLDYTKAVGYYKKGIQNEKCLYALGSLYEFGTGVERDLYNAREYYVKGKNAYEIYRIGKKFKEEGKLYGWQNSILIAAELGYRPAMLELGMVYLNGIDNILNINDFSAKKWLEKAANEGSPEAMYALSFMYKKGLGGEKDPSKELSYLIASAETGFPKAELRLARLYERGGLIDQEKALEIFSKVAKREGWTIKEPGSQPLPKKLATKEKDVKVKEADLKVSKEDQEALNKFKAYSNSHPTYYEVMRRLDIKDIVRIEKHLSELPDKEKNVNELLLALKTQDWNGESPIFGNKDLPYLVIEALKQGKITPMQMGTLLYFWGTNQYHLHTDKVKPLCFSMRSDNGFKLFLPLSQLPKDKQEELYQAFQSLPESEQQFLLVPDIEENPNIQKNPMLTSILQEIINTGLHAFNRVTYNNSKMKVIASLGMWQVFLNVSFGKQAVTLNPVIGDSSVEDIRLNGLNSSRDIAVPNPLALPSVQDSSVSNIDYTKHSWYHPFDPRQNKMLQADLHDAPRTTFTYHDEYHSYVASSIPPAHRILSVNLADQFNDMRKRIGVGKVRFNLIDMEFGIYRFEHRKSLEDSALFWSSIALSISRLGNQITSENKQLVMARIVKSLAFEGLDPNKDPEKSVNEDSLLGLAESYRFEDPEEKIIKGQEHRLIIFQMERIFKQEATQGSKERMAVVSTLSGIFGTKNVRHIVYKYLE